MAERREPPLRADVVFDRPEEVGFGIGRADALNRGVGRDDEIGRDDRKGDGDVEAVRDAVADEGRGSTHFGLDRVDGRDDVFASAQQVASSCVNTAGTLLRSTPSIESNESR